MSVFSISSKCFSQPFEENRHFLVHTHTSCCKLGFMPFIVVVEQESLHQFSMAANNLPSNSKPSLAAFVSKSNFFRACRGKFCNGNGILSGKMFWSSEFEWICGTYWMDIWVASLRLYLRESLSFELLVTILNQAMSDLRFFFKKFILFRDSQDFYKISSLSTAFVRKVHDFEHSFTYLPNGKRKEMEI